MENCNKDLLNTINNAAGLLLSAEDFSDFNTALESSLDIIGRYLNADRVQFWRVSADDTGYTLTLNSNWISQSAKKYAKTVESRHLSRGVFHMWEKMILNGEYYSGLLADMPQEEQSHIDPGENIIALTILPILLDAELWGVITTDNCTDDRLPSDAEMEVIRSISLIISGTYRRIEHSNALDEMRKALKTRNMLQSIVDTTPFAITIWDAEYNLIGTNSHFSKLFELPLQEIGISDFFRLSPECQTCGTPSRDKAMHYLEMASKTGSVRFEWIHQTMSGKPIPSEVTIVRAMYDGKKIFFGYILDLREIKDSAVYIRKVLDNAPLFVEFWDMNGNMFDCNQGLREALGIASSSELGRRFYEFSAPIQPCGTPAEEKNLLMMREAIQKGSSRAEWLFVLPNGTGIPTESTWTHIVHQDNPFILVYSQDLRNIREADQKMRDAVVLNEVLLNSSPLIMDIWDDTFTLISTSRQAVEMLELSSQEEYLERFSELSPPFQPCGTPSGEKAVNFVKQAFQTGGVTFEWLHQTLDKKLIPTEVTLKRFHRRGSDFVVAYTTDLRPVKEAMEREHQIKLRMQEQEILQKEQTRIEVAEESNKAKSRFLARMSHELRTPIAGVLSISEIQLQNPKISPETEEAFAKIYDSSNLLLKIVNDILDMSKIEAGKMSVSFKKYETAGFISDVTYMHTRSAGLRNVEFIVSIDEHIPKVLVGDEIRIKQVVNNILSNAFKYTESGSVKLLMKFDKTPDSGELVIKVCDTGFGMSREQISTLFNEDYVRFHEQEASYISGTGIGMAIVQNLIQLMGGKITVDSEVNRGTSVEVRIPQKISGSGVLGKKTAEHLQSFKMGIDSSAKKFKFVPEPMPYGRVLVVDDINANLYVAKGLLEFYNLQIETCINGYEALDKIKQGNIYDIVFMDQMMPGMDGTETLARMREMGYKGTVIALTASALIGQAKEFKKNGFDGFISKPIQTVHLNTLLIKNIRDKHQPEVIEAAKAQTKTSSPQSDISEYYDNPDMFKKLRMNFARNYKNVFPDIRHALNSGDTGTAIRLAHTVKGLAGLIKENALAAAAEAVEFLLVAGKTPTSKDLRRLEAEITRALDDINLSESPAPANFDKSRVITLLDEITPLLENRRGECLTLVDGFRGIPEAAVLVKQIDGLKFKAALQTAEVLKDIFAEA